MIGPRTRKEDIIDVVNEAQETLMPTDSVEVREQDQDEYYETPCDIEGYINERIRLND